MRFLRFLREKLHLVLISRTVLFFFLMCLLVLFLYAAGTVQEFIDSTQLFLLRLYVVLGILLALVSVAGVILSLWRFFRVKKIRYLARAGGYLFLMIFGVITVLPLMFIIGVSKGNGI